MRIDVGGVDEVDAFVDGVMDHADAVVVIGVAPRAEHHGAETEGADLETGTSEQSVLHGKLSTPMSSDVDPEVLGWVQRFAAATRTEAPTADEIDQLLNVAG